ncbi:hypothetical protein PENARI_c018G06942 [Penicillium arizonense]|uniref:Uncharacterized protein n=1 Tax=Penicillium arizonense TaxID=1835702 RepID=A0A1F5L9V2_PENAI|nr:hypothetical protein PENARI_c018G06942 [Penicillium arizonense]OGE50018.1 hypothetical protein PENARI_c018G06942 [Penicillium arizonense]
MGIQHRDQTQDAFLSTINPLIQEFGPLQVLDDLIHLRAADSVQYPILAYPRSVSDAAPFDYYTGQDLDDMINHTVTSLIDDGFNPG